MSQDRLNGYFKAVTSEDFTKLEHLKRRLRTLPKELVRDDNPTTTYARISGDCSDPRFVSKEARLMDSSSDTLDLAAVGLYVRCRQCPECLAQSRSMWTARSFVEVRRASRTWYATFTFGKDFRNRYPVSERINPAKRELTLALKRLRKKVGASKFKYIAVFEEHQDGTPHIHMLIHETDPTTRISWRQINEIWHKIGFHSTTLVDESVNMPIGYLLKYIQKDKKTRIRASKDYGLLPEDEREQALKAWMENQFQPSKPSQG